MVQSEMFHEVENVGQQWGPQKQQRKQNGGVSRSRTFSEEGRTIDTVSTHSGSSIGSKYHHSKYRNKENICFNDGPIGTSIEITPKKTVKRSNTNSNTKFDSASLKTRVENAPQKKIKAVSKQYAIRGRKENRHPNSKLEVRHHSLSRTQEVQMMARSRSQSVSRSRSHSATGRHSLGKVPNSMETRSSSVVPRSRPPSTYHSRRSRSDSRSESVSRSRSHSRHSTRSNAQSISSASEPNVHQDAVMTTRIHVECPTIVEMKENELFARKAGIDL
jgi:hypothetical protein